MGSVRAARLRGNATSEAPRCRRGAGDRQSIRRAVRLLRAWTWSSFHRPEGDLVDPPVERVEADTAGRVALPRCARPCHALASTFGVAVAYRERFVLAGRRPPRDGRATWPLLVALRLRPWMPRESRFASDDGGDPAWMPFRGLCRSEWLQRRAALARCARRHKGVLRARRQRCCVWAHVRMTGQKMLRSRLLALRDCRHIALVCRLLC